MLLTKTKSESECLRVIIKVWSNDIASIFTGQKSRHVDQTDIITWSMNFQQNSEINFKLVNWLDRRTDAECTVSVCVCTHAARSFIYLDESCTPLLPVNTWLASYWSVSAALWPPIGQLLHLNLPCKQQRCHHNLQCKDMILVSILRIKDQVFDFLRMANAKAIK